MKVELNCDNCGNEFSADSQRLKAKSICCSKQCAAELKIASKDFNTKCAYCGNEMYMKPYRLKRSKNVCCSHECSNALKAVTYMGEGNHQYGIKGEGNASHISDFAISRYGYLRVLSHQHPCRTADNRILFHRLVMEEHLKAIGDYENLVYKDGVIVLADNLVVHHIDENKLNNTIDNLQLMSMSEHSTHHSTQSYKKRQIDGVGRLLPGKITTGRLHKSRVLDAGQDIFSDEDTVIEAGSSKLISTDLRIEVPDGHVGLIWSRSGMSVKNKIEVGAGCIDIGYTGEVKVHLYNLGKDIYNISRGDKIAQLLTIPINLERYVDERSDKTVLELSNEPERGAGGFGSSGS